MALQLRNHETVIHPQPFVEQETYPLVITTQRVIWNGSGKAQEIEGAKIKAKAKGLNQRILIAVGLLVLLGAPLFLFGVYRYYTYRDKQTEDTPIVKGQPHKVATVTDKQQWASNKTAKILGIALGLFGAASLGVAYLLLKKRFTVIVAGAGKVFEIPVKDDKEQDKVLTMVGAAQTAAAAMASAQSAISKAPQPKR